jgi:nucleosome binding factor SPN SPT16 subunit
VSVVDKPPLVVSVEDIELVHFERVVNGGKSFDMSIVFKAGVADKGLDEFVRISSIEMRHKSNICVWLTEVAEVIWTEGPESINWKLLIQEQVREPYFWLDEDEEGNTKNIGMVEVLTPFEEGAGGGEDGEEEGSGEESEEYEESDDGGDDDDDDDDVSLVDEDDDDDDSDASEEEDEEEDDEEDMDESDVSSEKPKKKKK